MKARFNLHEVETMNDEETSLSDLRLAGCTNILVVARDHEAGTIRVECDLPDYAVTPKDLTLAYAIL
jgi:hypothetical protein